MFWHKFTEQAAFATGNFARLFGKLEIPPLPELAVRLLEMARQPEVDLGELSRMIESDVGISAKILQTVNSAQHGVSRKVTEIHQAVSLLGLKRIQSIALAFSAAQVLPKKAKGFRRVGFWQDSLQRAVFARTVVSLFAPGSEGEAFTGGLLQNMALPILLTKWGKHYLPVYESAQKSGRRLEAVEEEELTWTHANAGAWMASNWGLPDVLVCCLGLHNATRAELESVELSRTPVAAVAISSRLPDAREFCEQEFQIDEEAYQRVCESTDDACLELAELFKVPPPKRLAAPSA